MKRRQGVWLMVGLIWGLSGASGPAWAQGKVGGPTLSPKGNDREVRSRIYVSPSARQRVYGKVAVLPFQASVDLVGAIIGTVPEYGVKISGTTELVAIRINVRMIDVSDGSIVWSIADIAVSDRSLTLSALANQTVNKMVTQLFQEMIRAGDLQTANIPVPRVPASEGKLRGTIIEIQSDSLTTVTAYKILRSRDGKGPFQEAGSIENPGSRTVRYEDRDLLDGVKRGFFGIATPLNDETRYYYKVQAVNLVDVHSEDSPTDNAVTKPVPEMVVGLQANQLEVKQVSFIRGNSRKGKHCIST